MLSAIIPESRPSWPGTRIGEGVHRDLGPEAFLLRPRRGTFPFRSIGPGSRFGLSRGILGMCQYRTFPFMDLYANVSRCSVLFLFLGLPDLVWVKVDHFSIKA